MKRSDGAAEENTQQAADHTVWSPLTLVLFSQCVQRGGGKKSVCVCDFACVLGRLQSTVYANWQVIEGNNQPQANDCDGEAELVYATVDFGREKTEMQQK